MFIHDYALNFYLFVKLMLKEQIDDIFDNRTESRFDY